MVLPAATMVPSAIGVTPAMITEFAPIQTFFFNHNVLQHSTPRGEVGHVLVPGGNAMISADEENTGPTNKSPSA